MRTILGVVGYAGRRGAARQAWRVGELRAEDVLADLACRGEGKLLADSQRAGIL